VSSSWPSGGGRNSARGEDLRPKNKRGSRQDLYTNVFNYWCAPGAACTEKAAILAPSTTETDLNLDIKVAPQSP